MMHTYKGIVCEKRNGYMVFLTKEGDFLRGTPIGPTPEVGEEVEFHVVTVQTPRRKRMKPFIIGPAIVAAVLLLFLVASLIPQTNNAYAYVQLEGETTVELGVDENGNVVSLRSLDEMTPFTLDEWEGLPINVVLAKAVTQLIAENEKIIITTVYEKQNQEELKKRIDQAVNEVQKQSPNKVENKKPQKEKEAIPKETSPAVEHKQQEKEPDSNKEQPKPENGSNNNQNKEKQQEIKHQEKQQKEQEKIEKKEQKEQEKQQREQEKQQEKQKKEEEKSQAKQQKEEEKAEKQREKNERNKKDDHDNDENEDDDHNHKDGHNEQ